jgi:hypothetical protein
MVVDDPRPLPVLAALSRASEKASFGVGDSFLDNIDDPTNLIFSTIVMVPVGQVTESAEEISYLIGPKVRQLLKSLRFVSATGTGLLAMTPSSSGHDVLCTIVAGCLLRAVGVWLECPGRWSFAPLPNFLWDEMGFRDGPLMLAECGNAAKRVNDCKNLAGIQQVTPRSNEIEYVR